MKISDLVRLSTDNLRRRKGRTALTVIGVVVGTCAIVVMISLGIAMNKQTDAMLQSYGDLTQIQVYNFSDNPEAAKMDDASLQTIQQMEHVLAATPYYQEWNFSGNYVSGKKDRYQGYTYSTYGVQAEAMEPMGFRLISGTWLDPNISYGKDEIPVLVGQSFGFAFEDTKRKPDSPKRYRYEGMTDANGNPVEPFVDVNKDKIELVFRDEDGKEAKRYKLKVVGVLEQDYTKGDFTMQGVVMNLPDLQKVVAEYYKANKNAASNSQNKGTYQQVYVKVDDINNVAEVEDAIREMGFEDIFSMQQQREEMQGSVAKSQMILGGLAAISLLVAALNIMNTMTMAIYERTREIGIMKVLGCDLWQIHAMFLLESGFIGFIGGVVGVIVSLGISYVLNHLTLIMGFFGQTVDMSWLNQMMGIWGESGGEISVVPLWLILSALLFATLVGLLSGIAPAGRAVKISALEAIRHD